ncbi:hypothetical protein B0H12DRAFT_1076819 [Mycena haematopus]|nr:hypothetical protein B0H12DRAFT_1076819 [Mycena haematopus]
MTSRRVKRRQKYILRGEALDSREYLFSRPVADFVQPAIEAPIHTRLERSTADGRRVQTEVVSVEPPSPVKRQRQQYASTDAPAEVWDGLDFEPEGINGERYNMELGGFYPRAASPTPRRRRKPVDPWKPSVSSI